MTRVELTTVDVIPETDPASYTAVHCLEGEDGWPVLGWRIRSLRPLNIVPLVADGDGAWIEAYYLLGYCDMVLAPWEDAVEAEMQPLWAAAGPDDVDKLLDEHERAHQGRRWLHLGELLGVLPVGEVAR